MAYCDRRMEFLILTPMFLIYNELNDIVHSDIMTQWNEATSLNLYLASVCVVLALSKFEV